MTSGQPLRTYRELKLAVIDDPALPSRATMDDQKLTDLADSIRAVGLLEPMIVVPVGDRFEIVAGHRRRLACIRAGLVEASCIVYASRDVPMLLIQAHENSRREELGPADEAIWFSELLEQAAAGDVDTLCGLVGESRAYVESRLALLAGDARIFAALQRGDVKIGVAQELNRCEDERYRFYFLTCAIRQGATRAIVTQWIDQWRASRGEPAEPAPAGDPLAPVAPLPVADPFACYICGKSDARFIPTTIYVHQHCQLAILDPLLDAAKNGAPS